MVRTIVSGVIASILIIAGPSSGQPAQSSGATQGQAQTDPNEVVCQRESVVGSRLATRRVCMTRQQWADRRSQDRQDTERSQLIVPCAGGKSSPC
jgi:hypothetical protein